MAERAADRVTRLLGLLAYVSTHPQTPVQDLARHFGVSERQIAADVATLWVSGTPGYQPLDLIDFDGDALDQGVVLLREAQGMGMPLRLGVTEALVLRAAVAALADTLGDAVLADSMDVLRSVEAKLSEATEDYGSGVQAVEVDLGPGPKAEVVRALTEALRTDRALRLRYVTAADVVSERDVDPLYLETTDDRSHLLAWCLRQDTVRRFRLDRVLHAEVLDRRRTHRPDAAPSEPGHLGGDPRSHQEVRLVLASRARWVGERHPVEEVEELADGRVAVRLRVAEPAWLRHLLLLVADDVLAVQPPAMAEPARELARQTLAAYAELLAAPGDSAPGGDDAAADAAG